MPILLNKFIKCSNKLLSIEDKSANREININALSSLGFFRFDYKNDCKGNKCLNMHFRIRL